MDFSWRSLPSIGLDDRHITERWPPEREQLDNFLSNVLPAREESQYVEEVREWYRDCFKSEFKPRTRNLSVRLPYCHAKQGQYAGDKVEFVIVKDHKNRTNNMAAKEIPRGLYNVHLLRYFLEAEWQLPRPDVIISVTGGAQAFDLASSHKDMIMKGMMENTRDMQPLFITGGTNSGIMKYVGEARAKYNPTAPLIGITPMGPINGTPTLHELSHVAPSGDGRCFYKPEAAVEDTKAGGGWVFDAEERTWRQQAHAKVLLHTHAHARVCAHTHGPRARRCSRMQTHGHMIAYTCANSRARTYTRMHACTHARTHMAARAHEGIGGRGIPRREGDTGGGDDGGVGGEAAHARDAEPR
jgi:hypothetical protein